MSDPRDLLDPDALRARGSLKWTGMPADIAAWVAESDLGVAPVVLEAVHDAVGRGLLGYLPPAVRAALGEAFASWAGHAYDWHLDPARVRPVGHVTEGLRLAIDLFSRPGSPVILPTPAYMPFVTAPAVWGREVIQVPMARDAVGRPTLDLDAVDAAFRAGGHLFVLVNPQNPTGRVAERAELEALAEVVERHGGRVFADEIHAPLVHGSGRHVPYASVSPATAAHTVTGVSASKAWNIPGLKCAQVVLTNDADLETWRRHDDLLTEGASTVGAVANTAAYTHGRAWLADTLSYLDGNRHALAEGLAVDPRIGYRMPEGTYLAWLDLREALAALPTGAGPGAEPLGTWLRRTTGVALTDGALCGEAGAGHVRVNLAMPRPLVVEAGRRIAACLDR
ncbi:MalY/PatB family protein [Actinotalea fermentans]|uniref:cysteine-S-conjugate beta-lyase n=1 Tax=Actinotalea fermentans TaxID=43671 RepID=A0A511YT27_9CELL|nr:aminotransferase class I/II-fold pyridoxal phosphate-dependent enzyme [Actinotalea fermentans]KGM17628.1 aminotransferase class I/II [Actinotalea fermentans ATCC 43279 = JCM 9966 = DSM 3133]GEN78347.1 aminotransferase [Actinotalea fermentans]